MRLAGGAGAPDENRGRSMVNVLNRHHELMRRRRRRSAPGLLEHTALASIGRHLHSHCDIERWEWLPWHLRALALA